MIGSRGWNPSLYLLLLTLAACKPAPTPGPSSEAALPPRSPTEQTDSDEQANRQLELRASTHRLADSLPYQVESDGFVSSKACIECHANEHESWYATFHRTMTQVASPESIVAPFDGVRLSSRGQEFYLSRDGDRFFVTGPDPDFEAAAQANGVDLDRLNAPIVKREVVMTTGSHHMQGYWVASHHKNMLRQFPFTYIIAEKRWVPREDNFLVPPNEPRHFAVWNDNCIVCHAVGGKPKFDLTKMTVATEVAELGISCEACHGPGRTHVEFHRKGSSASPGSKSLDPIVNPEHVERRIASEICGQCHAYFSPHDWQLFGVDGYAYRPGGDLSKTHNLMTFERAKAESEDGYVGTYWNDGTCRVAGREYTAMMVSGCFMKGDMTCIDCHSMHNSDPNDQLGPRMDTNEACYQCHADYRSKLAEHTRHSPESAGSLCYNCHMPNTTYGALKATRSHRVQSPRVAPMAESDHPNACNLCHLDKSLSWTAEHLTDWYNQPTAELTDEEQQLAASLLWLLKGDAVQRAIVAWHMSWPPALEASGDSWQTPFLASALNDDYAAVRFMTAKSLEENPAFHQTRYDYVASKAMRERAREKILEAFMAEPATHASARSRELLWDPDADRLDVERLRQLLDAQDRRRIWLPE
jgi:predicted CXXCH cytochrome family protein